MTPHDPRSPTDAADLMDDDPDDYDPDACPLCSGTGRIRIMDDLGDGLAYDVCSACQGTGFDQ